MLNKIREKVFSGEKITDNEAYALLKIEKKTRII